MVFTLVFLPLIASAIIGVLSSKVSKRTAWAATSTALSISAIIAWVVFYQVVFQHVDYEVSLFRFIDFGVFSVYFHLHIDSLTAVMLIVVTTVSALVHIYSGGYMSDDPYLPRFMSYLSLFTFFMLLLVTSNNFLQLFIGWEGVGLCSYLLIGFWFKKEEANNAAMKAFLVNRVGDFGLILAILAIYIIFGSLNFDDIFTQIESKSSQIITIFGQEYHAITTICILLFIGAMGKSAQFGLHTWLPDAMEGPTPVSALIHAATMVTAGVFLVARCSPLFEHAPLAREMVTYVGAFTAIFAATIAITQNDIKRVIAYSTCSQLGYMFFACGVSAYSAGVFHLMTHGFFKALLFLGAGSVIHALENEQDMRNMGGVWKKIPRTYIMMWIGSLALAGIFPFAGFFSKDIILESAYAVGGSGRIAFWFGIAAAFLTAFYSWRLLLLVFHGKPRISKEVHVHESPNIMLIPLYILAIGAVLSGVVAVYSWDIVGADLAFWRQSLMMLPLENTVVMAHHVPLWVKLSPFVTAILGIATAYIFYIWCPSIPGYLVKNFSYIHKFLYNKWYIDELYNLVIIRPICAMGRFFSKYIDIDVIDRLGPNGASYMAQRLSRFVSICQTGYIYSYAFVMIIGLAVIMSWVLYGL